MQDDLQKAYMAYQQALYFLPNPKVSLNFPSPALLLEALRGKGTEVIMQLAD